MIWLDFVRFCKIWHGMAWFGMVWHGRDWHSMVWIGTFWHFLALFGMVWHGLAWFGLVWHDLAWFGMVWHGLAWLILGWHMWYEYMCAISSLNIPKSKPNHTKPNQISWYGIVWTKKEILSLFYPWEFLKLVLFCLIFKKKNKEN